jgi:hypothetical protein
MYAWISNFFCVGLNGINIVDASPTAEERRGGFRGANALLCSRLHKGAQGMLLGKIRVA